MSQPPYGNQPSYGGQQNPGGSQSGWGPPNPPVPPSYPPPQTGGLPSYGQPTQQFGQPTGGGGYGPPLGGQPPYGGGPSRPYGVPQPPKKSPLPFIIGGLVLLLVAGGVGLFLLLNDDDPTPIATSTSTSTSQTSESTEDTDSPTEDTDTGSPSGDPNFAESEAVAVVFIELMIAGEYDTARSSLCEDGQDMFADGQALADDFLSFLGPGVAAITDGEATDVYADPDQPDRDLVEFDLVTNTGNEALAVSIFEESGNLTICGYDNP